MKRDEEVEWEKDHGTRVEIELEGGYRGGQHSVDAYIRQISLANPHAQITYVPPKAEEHGDGARLSARHEGAAARDRRDQAASLRRRARRADADVSRHEGPQHLRGCAAERLLAGVSRRSRTRSASKAEGPAERRPREMTRDEADADPQGDPADEDHGPADGLHRADRRGADREALQ